MPSISGTFFLLATWFLTVTASSTKALVSVITGSICPSAVVTNARLPASSTRVPARTGILRVVAALRKKVTSPCALIEGLRVTPSSATTLSSPAPLASSIKARRYAWSICSYSSLSSLATARTSVPTTLPGLKSVSPAGRSR